MSRNYFLMVNGDYYCEGDYSYVKKEGLKLIKKAENGFVLPGSNEVIKTIEICMYNISLYEAE